MCPQISTLLKLWNPDLKNKLKLVHGGNLNMVLEWYEKSGNQFLGRYLSEFRKKMGSQSKCWNLRRFSSEWWYHIPPWNVCTMFCAHKLPSCLLLTSSTYFSWSNNCPETTRTYSVNRKESRKHEGNSHHFGFGSALHQWLKDAGIEGPKTTWPVSNCSEV